MPYGFDLTNSPAQLAQLTDIARADDPALDLRERFCGIEAAKPRGDLRGVSAQRSRAGAPFSSAGTSASR